MALDATHATIKSHGKPDTVLVKIPKGLVRNAAQAQRFANAARAKLPIEKIDAEIVVMCGEPADAPAFYGSTADAEALVRSIGPRLTNYSWFPFTLDI